MKQHHGYLVQVNNHQTHQAQTYLDTHSLDHIETLLFQTLEKQRLNYSHQQPQNQILCKAHHLADQKGFIVLLFDQRHHQWIASVFAKQFPLNPTRY